MKNIILSIFMMMNATIVFAQTAIDVDALVKRGFSQLADRSQYQQALKDFEQVIALSPDYIDAYIGKATILKRQGKWQKAKEVLLQGSEHIRGNQTAGQYLAEAAWQEGFYQFAQKLDQEYTPAPNRKIMEFTDEVNLNYGYDWLKNRDDWWELNFSYLHRLRPDHSLLFYYSHFDRAQDNDFMMGAGYVYKWNYITTLGVDMYFSDESGFTAEQKYRPRMYFRLPFELALGIGGNFDKFTDNWASVSHTEIIKYIKAYYVKYTFLTGRDNFNQNVTTHIGEMGYEKENDYSLRAGYASGNESIERVDRAIDSSLVIDSYFISGKYFIGSNWGVNLSVAREYRTDEYFRTSATTGIFYRF